MVREDEVDILVELTGHTANNKLGMMACRPAPVQVCLGFSIFIYNLLFLFFSMFFLCYYILLSMFSFQPLLSWMFDLVKLNIWMLQLDC